MQINNENMVDNSVHFSLSFHNIVLEGDILNLTAVRVHTSEDATDKSHVGNYNFYNALHDSLNSLMKCNTAVRRGSLHTAEPLFNRSVHWQAVYRILADGNYCQPSDFIGFKEMVAKANPDFCNAPLSYETLRRISQSWFVKPFSKWNYDASWGMRHSTFCRMYKVAEEFSLLLYANLGRINT